MEWYLKVLKEYANFNGRARRTEFWMFVLINLVVSILLSIVDGMLGFQFGLLSNLYALAMLVPTLAVGARRLHDTGRSGWWQLIAIIPLIGSLVLIFFFATEGHPESNEHGPSPK